MKRRYTLLYLFVLLILVSTNSIAQIQVGLTFPENEDVGLNPDSIDFEWTVIDTASEYQILINGDQNFDDPLINTITPNTRIKINELFSNWKFFWKVRAIFENDTSDWSSVFEFTTIYNPAVNFSPSNGMQVEDSLSAFLEWNIDLNSSLDSIQHNFRIQVSENASFEPFIRDFNLIDTNSVEILDLNPSITYYWHVQYYNDHGTSDWSAITNFTTNNLRPTQPALLIPEENESGLNPNNIFFEWESINGATSYNFEIAEDSLFANLIESSSVEDNSYITSVPFYNSIIYWRVQAVNNDDESPWSEVWKFTTSDMETAIGELSQFANDLELYQNYPNPFNPNTTIKFNLHESASVKIRIYNILGELITTLLNEDKNMGQYSVAWDGSNSKGVQTASGLYIYTMSVKNLNGKEILMTRRMLKIQ